MFSKVTKEFNDDPKYTVKAGTQITFLHEKMLINFFVSKY
jgi:hypothetical protein